MFLAGVLVGGVLVAIVVAAAFIDFARKLWW
jgi:hypothetical protein